MADLSMSISVDQQLARMAVDNWRNDAATAITATMLQLAEQIKQQGRASITASGMSARMANALRVDVYPKGKKSYSPAIYVHHNARYAEIFQLGGTINGSPYLWLPLPIIANMRIGGKRITPKVWMAERGPLYAVPGRGNKTPLLVGKMGGGKSSKRYGNRKAVPLFFGISVVTIKKRWNIYDICESAYAQIPAVFQQNLGSS